MLGTTFLLAIRSIMRHKLRSILTALGIIIGVAAVVTMVTLGQATTAAVQKSISALGTNILQIRPGQGFGRGGGGPGRPISIPRTWWRSVARLPAFLPLRRRRRLRRPRSTKARTGRRRSTAPPRPISRSSLGR
jgi:hypothetical protein